jgi:hypothetical protein
MQHPVPRDPKTAVKYANYTLYTCCTGCKAKYNAMTPAEKKTRAKKAIAGAKKTA